MVREALRGPVFRRVRGSWEIVRDACYEWNEDDGSRMGAALAFYTIFSLAPLLTLVIAATGLAFGEPAVRARIVGQIGAHVGSQAALAIEGLLTRVSQSSSGGAATIAGIFTLFIGASSVVLALKNDFNAIWKAKPKPGVLALFAKYVFSYAAVLGLGVLALLSLAAGAGLGAAGRSGFGLATLVGLLAATFKWLPDAAVDWRDVWFGAILTALLLVAGKLLLGVYLARRALLSVYGAAGSLVIVLLWVYYSAQIMYLGVEVTKVSRRRRRGL